MEENSLPVPYLFITICKVEDKSTDRDMGEYLHVYWHSSYEELQELLSLLEIFLGNIFSNMKDSF